MGIGALTEVLSGRGVRLTTHLHLVPRLRIRGAIPPLTQYVSLAWCLVKHRDDFSFIFQSVYEEDFTKLSIDESFFAFSFSNI
jgi:hypothetical protein